jgi:hypothetical protein
VKKIYFYAAKSPFIIPRAVPDAQICRFHVKKKY